MATGNALQKRTAQARWLVCLFDAAGREVGSRESLAV